MRRVAYVSIGVCLGIIAGSLVSWAFNTWYSARFVHSDDDSNILVAYLLFGFWPVSAVLGAWLANRAYRRRLSR